MPNNPNWRKELMADGHECDGCEVDGDCPIQERAKQGSRHSFLDDSIEEVALIGVERRSDGVKCVHVVMTFEEPSKSIHMNINDLEELLTQAYKAVNFSGFDHEHKFVPMVEVKPINKKLQKSKSKSNVRNFAGEIDLEGKTVGEVADMIFESLYTTGMEDAGNMTVELIIGEEFNNNDVNLLEDKLNDMLPPNVFIAVKRFPSGGEALH